MRITPHMYVCVHAHTQPMHIHKSLNNSPFNIVYLNQAKLEFTLMPPAGLFFPCLFVASQFRSDKTGCCHPPGALQFFFLIHIFLTPQHSYEQAVSTPPSDQAYQCDKAGPCPPLIVIHDKHTNEIPSCVCFCTRPWLPIKALNHWPSLSRSALYRAW